MPFFILEKQYKFLNKVKIKRQVEDANCSKNSTGVMWYLSYMCELYDM